MDKTRFAAQLRRIRAEIQPCTQAPADADPASGQPLPYGPTESYIAHVQGWYQLLQKYAQIVENHCGPLTSAQRETIGSNLFRGMGSFSDFALDERVFGEVAAITNDHLLELRAELYRLFQE